jgi:four helix bundle protein
MDDERNPGFEDGQDIRDRAFEFACRIVRFCQKLYEVGGIARMMAPQLLACGTSASGMLEEARAAESKRDFVSKCCIGLKELREAHGRLRIHVACKIGPIEEAAALREEANALVSIVWTIVRNTRANAGLTTKSRPNRRSFTKVIANS